ncbi:MAG: AAA family ATPase [Gammaproteobacteria bacterium]|nr:AAA family ATPase [Gammaproteobacteria bacterium]
MSNTTTRSYETKSTASSSYVVHYHMTREPFADAIEDDLFYAEPGRQQKLDILLHLTQYGDELVLVAGPPGSGKTTLLQQYLSRALDTWIIARIDAQGGIDERKLLQQLFHQMNMDFHGATHSELFERMQHHFDALQHSALQAVLLIDNAEQLSVTALKRVLEMVALASTDNKPLLRVILFGTRELDEHFHDPLLGPKTHVVRRSVDLSPFAQAHTAHYILHRLSAANFSADKPFTDAVLQKIHKQSIGWPGEINRLAHNVLIESLPTAGGSLGNISNINKVRAATAITGIVLLGTLLFFQDEFNTWLTPRPAATISQPALVSPPIAAPATIPDEAPIPDVIYSPALPSQEIVEKSADTDITSVLDSTESTMPDTTITTATSTAMVSPIPAVAPLIVEPESIKHSADIVVPPVTNTSPIPVDLPGFRNAWILKQNPGHYTLQMVAGNNINTLRSFIRQYPLDEPLAIYHTTRKGKTWFGLIQHSYPSKQAALDARRQLPAALRQQNPWLRQFSALQKDLAHSPPGRFQ